MARGRMSIRKDDTVIVIAGKDKGKTGRVLRVLRDKGRVVVERLNVVKRHSRPSAQNRQGGIVEKEAPLHLSNVMLVDDRTGKPVRVGFKKLEDGKKVRVCHKTAQMLDR
ncbi:MAG: 50S ribosomal protein L24 [Candidatus Methylomirabilis sp.]|nr:50S ribosomal protein L24 [Deltaproteobacteria bacterium]